MFKDLDRNLVTGIVGLVAILSVSLGVNQYMVALSIVDSINTQSLAAVIAVPRLLSNTEMLELTNSLISKGIILSAQATAARSAVTGNSDSTVTPYVFTKELKAGDTGADVTAMKIAMNITPVNDVFGPITIAGVKAFQIKNNLPDTGVVDEATIKVLNSMSTGGTTEKPKITKSQLVELFISTGVITEAKAAEARAFVVVDTTRGSKDTITATSTALTGVRTYWSTVGTTTQLVGDFAVSIKTPGQISDVKQLLLDNGFAWKLTNSKADISVPGAGHKVVGLKEALYSVSSKTNVNTIDKTGTFSAIMRVTIPTNNLFAGNYKYEIATTSDAILNTNNFTKGSFVTIVGEYMPIATGVTATGTEGKYKITITGARFYPVTTTNTCKLDGADSPVVLKAITGSSRTKLIMTSPALTAKHVCNIIIKNSRGNTSIDVDMNTLVTAPTVVPPAGNTVTPPAGSQDDEQDTTPPAGGQGNGGTIVPPPGNTVTPPAGDQGSNPGNSQGNNGNDVPPADNTVTPPADDQGSNPGNGQGNSETIVPPVVTPTEDEKLDTTDVSNYGQEWNEVLGLKKNWQSIAISESGKYIVAVPDNGYIYTTNDYGNTWSTKTTSILQTISTSTSKTKPPVIITKIATSTVVIPANTIWETVKVSKTGKYQAAVDRLGTVFVSSDYGQTWLINKNNPGFLSFFMSPDGRFQQILGQNSSFTSNDFGITWVEKKHSEYFQSPTWSSPDGKYQIAETTTAGVRASSDFGNTWSIVDIDNGLGLTDAAISGDGKHQMVVNGIAMWESFDYGKTWSKSIQTTSTVNMTDDGKYVIFVSRAANNYPSLTISKDYGKTRSIIMAPTGKGFNGYPGSDRIAISANGRIQSIITSTFIEKVETPSPLYMSTDYGVTWSLKNNATDLKIIKMSADGKVQITAGINGKLYISNSAGTKIGSPTLSDTFLMEQKVVDSKISQITSNFVLSSSYDRKIKVSDNGRYQFILTWAGYLITSSDFGKTWSIANADKNIYDFEISKDGKYVTINGDLGSELLVSSDYGKTFFVKATTSWIGDISMSKSGQFQVTTMEGVGGKGKLLYSADYGETWNNIAPETIYTAAMSVIVSDDGQTILLNEMEKVRVSSDAGKTWYENKLSGSYMSHIVMSSTDGKYQTAVHMWNKNIFTSSDYGKTWTSKEMFINEGSGIAISADGRYQIVSGSESEGMFVSSDYGKTWTNKVTKYNPANKVVSSDGMYQFANKNVSSIDFSSDFGQTWTSKVTGTKTNYGLSVSSMSNDGRVMVISGDNKIQVSTDSGKTWTIVLSDLDSRYFTATPDNQYQGAILYGVAYLSKDFGQTWKVIQNLPFGATSLGISANGGYVTVGINSNNIYTSKDFGVSWTPSGIKANWSTISLSSDGRYQVAGIKDGKIYVSSDYGATWMARGKVDGWFDIKISPDGKYQMSLSRNSLVVSKDYGVTWVQKTASAINSSISFTSIAMSPDAKIQYVSKKGAQSMISKDFGVTWKNVVPKTTVPDGKVYTDGNLLISLNSGTHAHKVSTDFGVTWQDVNLEDGWTVRPNIADQDMVRNVRAYSYEGLSQDLKTKFLIKEYDGGVFLYSIKYQ